MTKVSIIKCPSYTEEHVFNAVKNALDHMGGMQAFVKPGMKVTVKPNLLMRKKPGDAATTNPFVVKAIIRLVQESGGIVTIAESPGGPYIKQLLKSVYSGTGIEQVANETGAILNYDLRLEKVSIDTGLYLKSVHILKPIADADLVINIPKLKSHMMMVYTGAVKNMFGAIAGTVKADYHLRMSDYDNFANSLIDIFLSTKTTLSIMDAIESMEGHGPSAGTVKKTGLILASENAFALDYTAACITNLDYTKVPVLYNAEKRNLLNIQDIQHIGEAIENVKVDSFDYPSLLKDRVSSFSKWPLNLITKKKPKVYFDMNKCVGCKICVQSCPPKVLQLKDKQMNIDHEGCIRCFCCHELCPEKAISIKRPFISRMLARREL